VWRWKKSVRAPLTVLPLCKGTVTGQAGIDALADRLINRMRQMSMRCSLFKQQTGTGIQERFSIPIPDVKREAYDR
jgi:hypothetical protein